MPTLRASCSACLLLLLAGCAGAGAPPTLDPSRLEVVVSGRQVHLSQPAYLAVFEMRGRQGTSIVYPLTAETAATKTPAGLVALERESRRRGGFVDAQRDLYTPVATGLLNRELGDDSEAGDDVHWLAIASAEPLNVAPLLESAAAVRRLLGSDYDRPSSATQRLVQILAPREPAVVRSGRGELVGGM